MIKITESIDGRSLAEKSMITESVKIDWPQAKDLPSSSEFASLNRLIASKYQALAATNQREHDQFWAAFIWLFFARRTDAPNRRIANDDLVGHVNDWIAAHNPGLTPITAKALVAAVIAHGNIPFSEPPWPSLGLAYGSTSEMQPSAWRKVLEAGRLPDGLAARPLDRSIGSQIRSSVG